MEASEVDEVVDIEKDKESSWTILNWLIAIFSTIGGLCFSAMLFLIPFIIDPAISALQADFNPNPVTCTVVNSAFKVGLSKCFWSSCLEGCTRELYQCYQVEVEYEDQEEHQLQNGILLVNSRGCGYPPDVSCQRFFTQYGNNNSEPFDCYYSRRNNSIVVPLYDASKEKSQIICGLIPMVVIIISIIIVYIAYKMDKKRREEEDKTDPGDVEDVDVEDEFAPDRSRPTTSSSSEKDKTSKDESFQLEPIKKRRLQDMLDMTTTESPILKKRIKHPF